MSIEWIGVVSVISSFTDFIYGILKRLRINFDGTRVYLSLEKEKYEGSIDERIAKIDIARANLVEGLNAINELKETAERNKKEVEVAIQQVTQLEKDKTFLQRELEAVKTVVQTDVDAFRKVAGVLTPSQIRRERVIGFISGVAASVTASAVIWFFVWLIHRLFAGR